jgi:hypothetical protein
VTIHEAELLRIIGAKLDCPIPPLLAEGHGDSPPE